MGCFRLDRGDYLHNLLLGSLELRAFADMSAVLPIDYLSKTIVAVMTEDLHRIGRDFGFLNTRTSTCNDFFKLLGAASGGKKMIAFSTWKLQAMEHATANPTSPLARIAAVFDEYTDETASDMFKNLCVGEHVFGPKDYPAPLIDEDFVGLCMNHIAQRAKAKV